MFDIIFLSSIYQRPRWKNVSKY